MKIYTKTGDGGTTSLFGGKRVDKNSLRIETYGNVDELNSQIGTVIAQNPVNDVTKKLTRIQKELFILGCDLASPNEVKVSTSLKLRGASKVPRVKKSMVTKLEREIDKWSTTLPQLKKFILPGGGQIGAKLHLARTVARRVERSIVELASQEKINKNALIYINRLSDWFFVLARLVNKMEDKKEIIWKGRG